MKRHRSKNYIKGSFMLDALTSFSLIITLLLIFLPVLINQHVQFRKEIEKADMYRTLITIINRFNINEIQQGIQLEHYTIEKIEQSICIKSNETDSHYCFKVKSKKK
ncbi:hypothetical protein [Staphylococcus simulans]|uniref:hypothetical protein n=1 Tax=Staphylococcus simulans TaxID=1286 RepID=UPI00130498C4|nr:hypothetical protein [Staphylococcus simulans]